MLACPLIRGRRRGRGYAGGAESAGGLRAAASDGGHTVLAIGRWSLDIDAHTFRIDDEPVSLTNIEFAIIELRMNHPDTVFSKRQVYELCWGEPYMVDDNTVTAHISKIRAKLKASGTDGYIRTVWGWASSSLCPAERVSRVWAREVRHACRNARARAGRNVTNSQDLRECWARTAP